ncbi:hypothetical protein J6590_077290 [Homalodisca vitripennis]|nr:hypothetical protein J6590_095805 [Homalodisca vitripennis]KAG8285594.1 hypothetical protein J6590_077290 [Homalodisca vitripennis]
MKYFANNAYVAEANIVLELSTHARQCVIVKTLLRLLQKPTVAHTSLCGNHWAGLLFKSPSVKNKQRMTDGRLEPGTYRRAATKQPQSISTSSGSNNRNKSTEILD